MPLEGLRWSRDSGSALYDTPQNGRSRTGWGGAQQKVFIYISLVICHFSLVLRNELLTEYTSKKY